MGIPLILLCFLAYCRAKTKVKISSWKTAIRLIMIDYNYI